MDDKVKRPSGRVINDSLTNLVSGLNTDKDKNAFSQYIWAPLNDAQLLAAYRGDWIARKIVDIPASDATRRWRSWQADNAEIEKIEATEKKLGVRRKINAALRWGRLLGGGAVIMGFGDSDPTQPVDVDSPILKQGLKYLHPVSRITLQAGPLEQDILQENFKHPQYYVIASNTGTQTQIHYSRVVRFAGNDLPDGDPSILANQGWGDSVIQACDDAIKQAGNSAANLAALVQEAKIDVIKVPGLLEQVQDPNFRDQMMERYRLANIAKSTLNSLLLDGNEEWERITINFSGLDEVLRLYLMIASGAADIPATRLLGQAPKGLNATGDSDMRNYYDRIQSDQEDDITPAITLLDEALLWTTFGSRDPSIYYEWEDLWQMTDAEKAELQLKKAQAHQVDVAAALIPAEALRVGRQNQLIEDGVYPGLEAALEDLDALEVDPNADQLNENDPNVLAQLAAQQAAAGGGALPPEGRPTPAVPAKPAPKPGSNVVALRRTDAFDADGDDADFNFVTSDGHFTGYAVRWGKEYHDGIRAQRGAFAAAIERTGGKVRLLYQHDEALPIGMAVLSEDDVGLRVEGQLNMTLELSKEIKDNIEKNILNGLSIGYIGKDVTYAPNDKTLMINVPVMEVSVVTFPSMEEATIDTLTIGDMAGMSDDALRAIISQAVTAIRGAA
jgi:HK97 family phage prohead protease